METEPPRLDLAGLRAASVLGRGGKGVVFLVRDAGDNTLALKVISKSHVDDKKKKKNTANGDADPHRRIRFERDVLASLRHPLLPSLRGVVETEKVVGFAMDACAGGNLASLRARQTEHMFSDELIRFYAAELVLALEHLHSRRIVYRDLKPENILIQESGHIMLVDFDLSVELPAARSPSTPAQTTPNPNPTKIKKRRRILSCFSVNNIGVSPETPEPAAEEPKPKSKFLEGKSNSFVGTQEYIAPEIIKGSGHDYAVDWWGLGVVLYEMLYGRTPFRGKNRSETFYLILSKEPELAGERTALRDLIRRLLEKDPERRIGCEEIKRHEFFGGVVWEEVVAVARAPFIPAGVGWEEDGGVLGIDVEEYVEGVWERKEGNSKSGEFREF